MRVARLFRVYDERGAYLDDELLSTRLDKAIIREGGFIQRNCLNPKDPRRKGEWSDTVETRPLHPHILVDSNCPHLATEQRVAYLCSFRTRCD